jgi:glycosyltransferase involved in cell wall biosynthesis
MKIVQIVTDNREQIKDYDNPTPHFGTAPEALLEGFSRIAGVEVHVISCVRQTVAEPHYVFGNIHYHSVRVPKYGWMSSLYAGCIRSVRRLIRELNPDIVHGQGTERNCAMCAVYSGYPNVITIHGNMRVHAASPELRGNVYYKLAAMLETFSLRRTSGVVAISNYTKDLVQDLTPRTWLLPNAAAPQFFDIELSPPVVPRILFVGYHNPRKNPLGLLQACAPMLRAGKCTLALAGQFQAKSEYGREVMALAESLPGVTFLGFMNRDGLAYEFTRSSLLVLPTFEDNCPMVVLEAMAAGIPVAASRVGGVPDLINHEKDGLMFDPNDHEEVRSCVERLVEDPELRHNLGSCGRAKARKSFHPRVIAERHVEIYREVLGKSPH